LVRCGSQLSHGLTLIDVSSGEESIGISEGVSSIPNLGGTESNLAITLILLCGVEIIMCDLFHVDCTLEPIEHALDGVEGVSGLDLSLNLDHHVHYVTVSELVLREEVIGEGVGEHNQGDQ